MANRPKNIDKKEDVKTIKPLQDKIFFLMAWEIN